MRTNLIYLMSSLFLFSSNALAIELCGNFAQGELIVAKDGAKTSLFALKRDEAEKYRYQNIVFDVAKTKWDLQSIKGVAQNKVTPSSTDQAEIKREQKDVSLALHTNDKSRQDWKKGFILPLDGTISGHFGNQRIFNGVPKSPHSGTDIAALAGTPVKASGDGKVLLSGGNYFYSGNMVIIDHGQGLQTIYAHLQKTSVKKGDEVKQGDIIGYVGQTGRATGPHLHWGASVHNIRFRPHSLLDINTKSCRSY